MLIRIRDNTYFFLGDDENIIKIIESSTNARKTLVLDSTSKLPKLKNVDIVRTNQAIKRASYLIMQRDPYYKVIYDLGFYSTDVYLTGNKLFRFPPFRESTIKLVRVVTKKELSLKLSEIDITSLRYYNLKEIYK